MGASTHLRDVAAKLRQSGQAYNCEPSEHPYEMLSDLMDVCALLCEWSEAVAQAVLDADRFLRAAKVKARIWSEAKRGAAPPVEYKRFAEDLQNLVDPAQVGEFARRLAGVPLPLGVYVQRDPPRLMQGTVRSEASEPAPEKLVVAFLKFTIDGVPATELHFVQPNEVHDLDIEVRVSRWPIGAESLQLRPVSTEPNSVYELPVFKIPAPVTGDGPYAFKERGRAVLNVPQALRARPFEFKYAAEFRPNNIGASVWAEGHRTLRLEAVNWRASSLTGYHGLDKRIVEVRDQLRSVTAVPEEDLTNTLHILTALGNLAGQSVQDALFDSGTQEPSFQTEVRRWLRTRPEIGAELEEHPHAAGGITDLSFRGIRIELKAETASPVTLSNCSAYTAQAASYAVGTGKRIAVLCVLDSVPKTSSPYPAEDGLGLLTKTIDHSTIYIPTLIIQGGLARPSSLKGR